MPRVSETVVIPYCDFCGNTKSRASATCELCGQLLCREHIMTVGFRRKSRRLPSDDINITLCSTMGDYDRSEGSVCPDCAKDSLGSIIARLREARSRAGT